MNADSIQISNSQVSRSVRLQFRSGFSNPDSAWRWVLFGFLFVLTVPAPFIPLLFGAVWSGDSLGFLFLLLVWIPLIGFGISLACGRISEWAERAMVKLDGDLCERHFGGQASGMGVRLGRLTDL